jgi:hypothetical protein
MRSAALLPASLIAAALAIGFAPGASAEVIVNIDKSTQSMTVTVDGTPRYIWPVSTGRPGYDTPNGTFKANRMDADHLSQEWDNAPMPHTIFFDMHGHAIHGFLNTSHIGTPASHGCVRLEPDHAAALFDLVESQGLKETTVVISGRTPHGSPEVARRRGPVEVAAQPMQLAPSYGTRPAAAYGQQPAASGPQQAVAYGQQPASTGQQQPTASGQQPTLFGALFGQPARYEQQQQPAVFGQQPAGYVPPQPPAYGQQPYYVQQLSSGQRLYFYAQPGTPQPQNSRPYTQY